MYLHKLAKDTLGANSLTKSNSLGFLPLFAGRFMSDTGNPKNWSAG